MLIGLSVNHKEGLSCIADGYVNSIAKAGGTPVLIPILTDEQKLDEVLSNLDGLVLSGGGDIHSSFFNEDLHPTVTDYDLDRDVYDLALVKLAVKKQIPILGICRGSQVMNVALGGGLIQDIPSHIPTSKIRHSQSEPREQASHSVSLEKGTLLYSIFKKEQLQVNSIHHQAVGEMASGFKVSAYAPDGTVEAVESDEGYSLLGVQWHPECMVAGTESSEMIHLFQHIVSEADTFHRAKEIHKKYIILDSHTDTPMYFPYKVDIGKDNKAIKLNPKDLGAEDEDKPVYYRPKVDIPKMEKGMVDAAVMVAYIPQSSLSASGLKKAFDKSCSILNTLSTQLSKIEDRAEQAKTANDLIRLKSQGKRAILFGLENGYGIGNNIQNLQTLADLGVVYITLSHNGDNHICDAAAKSKKTHNGLSEFGKEVVKEMNRLGIIIDISHTSEKTSYDVLALSEYPIIASHSSVKALCDHPRNMLDDLIKAVAAKGGVVQVCLYTGFLKKKGTAKVKDAVDHIEYIIKLVGEDHVGIGSDFDGGGGFTGLKDITEVIQITQELLRRGYSEETIRKIWGGNFIRVMNDVQNKVKVQA